MDILRTVKGFVVEPVWRQQNEMGIYTSSAYSNDDELPAQAMPIQGIIAAAPDNSPAKKGDTLYFTWNGVSANQCISHRSKGNQYFINHSCVAYKNDKGIFPLEEFVLLDFVVEKEAEEITESGIILKGFEVKGDQVVEKVIKKAREGVITHIPENCDIDIKVGDRIKVDQYTDVECEIDGKFYYRVRFEDILCTINSDSE